MAQQNVTMQIYSFHPKIEDHVFQAMGTSYFFFLRQAIEALFCSTYLDIAMVSGAVGLV